MPIPRRALDELSDLDDVEDYANFLPDSVGAKMARDWKGFLAPDGRVPEALAENWPSPYPEDFWQLIDMYYFDSEAQREVRTLIKTVVATKVADFRARFDGQAILGPGWVQYNSLDELVNRFKLDSTLEVLRVYERFVEKGETLETGHERLVQTVSDIKQTMARLYGLESIKDCRALFLPARMTSFTDVPFALRQRVVLDERLIKQCLTRKLAHEKSYSAGWRQKVKNGKHKGTFKFDLGTKSARPVSSKWRFPQTISHPDFPALRRTAAKAATYLFELAACCEFNIVKVDLIDQRDPAKARTVPGIVASMRKLAEDSKRQAIVGLFPALAVCPKKARQSPAYFLQYLKDVL